MTLLLSPSAVILNLTLYGDIASDIISIEEYICLFVGQADQLSALE